jgi:uncharacterized protein (DUF736 family)
MASIGVVTCLPDGTYKGQLKTFTICADIEIVSNLSKSAEGQPDYRVRIAVIEIGAGWDKVGEMSGKSYVSLSLAAPEFGPRKLDANLGRAAGQDIQYPYLWVRQRDAGGMERRKSWSACPAHQGSAARDSSPQSPADHQPATGGA